MSSSTITEIPERKRRGAGRAGAWWLLDSAGAVAVALALATLVGRRAEGHAALVWVWLLLAGGALRAFAVARARVSGQIAANAEKRMVRENLHRALLPTRLQRARLVGEDLHLAVDAVDVTEGLTARFSPLRLAATVSPFFIALAAAPASVVAAGIMLVTLAPFGLAMALAGSAARRAADAQHQALSRLSGLFVDRVRTLPAILAFGAEARVAAHLGTASADVAQRTLAVLRIAFLSSAVLEFFAALSVALVAVYCGFSLLGLLPFPALEHLTLTRAFFVLALAPEFYLGMRRLAAAYHDKQTGEAALAAIAGERARMPAPVATQAVASAATALAARGLVLRHPEGAAIAVPDADWRGPGFHTITGPTGAGKSSLLLALIGHVPIEQGTLTRDGAPFVPGALNPAIGWAGQSVALVPGTLRDNLVMADTPPDEAATLILLGRLGLGTMIGSRGGLDAPLDHRGSGLSGGERRRIGLARAILSGRPILLLDEPTADLDADTARAIRAVLADQAARRLVIAATHDADLIAIAGSTCRLS